jgi:hypothetical protein
MSGVQVPTSFQLAAVMLIAVYCEGIPKPRDP